MEPETSATSPTATSFWEARYAESGQVWSGHVNTVLADVASGLGGGRALDLGCGEGGDAIWLAQHGWLTTGVDLSPTAVERGRAAATSAGLSARSLHFEAADLMAWTPTEPYDLVAASFFQSWPVEVPREQMLRRATGFVAPGGYLLVVSHTGAPSWADAAHVADHPFPTPAEDLAALALAPNGWDVLVCEEREREVTAPDGTAGTILDGVVLVRRR